MRIDPSQNDGQDDPLDAALGDLHDFAELEQRFADLDAELATGAPSTSSSGDDPFADIAAVLEQHRAHQLPDDIEEDEDSSDVDEVSLTNLLEDEHTDDVDEPSDGTSAEIEAQCQDALDALELGEVESAREIAMAAVRLDDEHPFPIFVLGLVAEREDDLDTARDMAELALKTARTNPDAIGLRAHVHVRQHELEDAEALLRFGIAHNPDEAQLHEALARVTLALGRHETALDAARTALRIEPANAGALAVRAAALDAGTDRGAVLAALRQGVQLHPEDPYAMVELASIEMEHGNVQRARVLLSRAQRLAPRDREIYDIRTLVEHVDDQFFLRPVPALLRWMRDFPGGLAGFVIGLFIAALPMHALATTYPVYRVPAIFVVAVWAGVALYAWLAPPLLTHRLNERAARSGRDRLLEELNDPEGTAPDPERVADVAAVLVMARRRREALELLDLAAARARTIHLQGSSPDHARLDDEAESYDALARMINRRRLRLQQLVYAVPALGRLFVASALTIAITAPLLTSYISWPVAVWHAIALALLVGAVVAARTERTVNDQLDNAVRAIAAS